MMSSTSQLVGNSNKSVNQMSFPQAKFPKLSTTALLVFSIFNFLLWVLSISLQVTLLSSVPAKGLDVVFPGIWVGFLYGITGFFGYSASYKKTRSLLTITLVFSAFSICGSIVCVVLSGIMANSVGSYEDYCSENRSHCIIWEWVEWLLVGTSILAFTVNIAIVTIVAIGVRSRNKTLQQQQLQQQQQQQQRPYVTGGMAYGYNASPNTAIYSQRDYPSQMQPRKEQMKPVTIGY